MYYWDLEFGKQVSQDKFQQLLEECTIGTTLRLYVNLFLSRFSSCQKNVLLGLTVLEGGDYGDTSSFSSCQKNVLLGPKFMATAQIKLRVSVVVRRMYYWDQQNGFLSFRPGLVSVVVRRMYYWDSNNKYPKRMQQIVSVVVRRMYYWDRRLLIHFLTAFWFQQLLEECTIGTPNATG